MRKRLLTIALLVGSMAVKAQTPTFHFTAPVPTVAADGFYRIKVTPDLSAKGDADLHNVRIIDSLGHEVPYIVEERDGAYETRTFNDYAVVDKMIRKGCCTTIILKNDHKDSIDNISLVIRNADVVKYASLQGSDDKMLWFALKDQFTIGAINNSSGTKEVNEVYFPLSRYVYYRLLINDSTSSPINIERAGYYNYKIHNQQYHAIPGPVIRQRDSVSEKSTYITLEFPQAYRIDQLDLHFTGAPFFQREMSVYVPRKRTTKHKKTEQYLEFLTSAEISSSHANTILFDSFKGKQVVLVVENHDNPTLTLHDVRVSQQNRFVTAWLQHGAHYTLKTGNLSEPHYDLGYFTEKIPANASVLAIETLMPVDVKKEEHESPTFFTNRTVIWIAIIVVIILLGFMSVKMVRETSKR